MRTGADKQPEQKTRQVFLYEDAKHKPIMVYLDRPYPYGIYLGHFDTMKEAEDSINEWKGKARVGIPLCSALVDCQKDHGMYDMGGLKLLQEVEVEL